MVDQIYYTVGIFWWGKCLILSKFWEMDKFRQKAMSGDVLSYMCTLLIDCYVVIVHKLIPLNHIVIIQGYEMIDGFSFYLPCYMVQRQL